MTTNADMTRALKDHCVPKLRAMGFKGSYPHFHRAENGEVSLVNFQFSSGGSQFCVNLAFVDAEQQALVPHLPRPRAQEAPRFHDLAHDQRRRGDGRAVSRWRKATSGRRLFRFLVCLSRRVRRTHRPGCLGTDLHPAYRRRGGSVVGRSTCIRSIGRSLTAQPCFGKNASTAAEAMTSTLPVSGFSTFRPPKTALTVALPRGSFSASASQST